MTAWKNTERKIAGMLGGERVPITGRTRGSAPDIKHNWLSLEVKHRKKLPDWLHDAMDQAEKSNKGDQLPAVILHEKQQKHGDNFVVLRLKDFIAWFGDVDESQGSRVHTIQAEGVARPAK